MHQFVFVTRWKVALFIFVINILGVYSQEACTTPNGERAFCKSITSCAPFVNTLQQGFDLQQKKFIGESLCHFDKNNQPVVCCGSDTRYRSLLPDRSQCGYQIDYRIVGGIETFISEFPWTALLKLKDKETGDEKFNCAGTLISSKYVLTAAQCVTNSRKTATSVRLGEWNLDKEEDCIGTGGYRSCSPPPQDIQIENIVYPEEYNPTRVSRHGDIALIRLATRASLNDFVQPICLPLPTERSSVGQNLYAVGWGSTEFGGYTSSKKLKVKLPVVDLDTCRNSYKSTRIDLDDRVICAGEGGKDTCAGDSGGPLLAQAQNDTGQFYIEGITSFGRACGLVPSVYTRVSSYLDWIMLNVKP